MRRKFTAITVCVCALLLGCVLGNWFHSLDNSETYIYISSPRIYAIDNVEGQISFWRGELMPAGQAKIPDGYYHEHREAPHMRKTEEFEIRNFDGEDLWLLGFAATTQRRFPSTVQTVDYDDVTKVAGIVIPLWAPTIVLILLMLRGTYKLLLRHERATRNLCQTCGYDLRASSDRCPECGSSIAAT
jgi:hypothetical protein